MLVSAAMCCLLTCVLTVPGASCVHGTLSPAQPKEVGTVLLSLLHMGLLGGGAVIWTQAIFAPKFMPILKYGSMFC